MPYRQERQTSGYPPWVWIGCGCLLAILVVIGAVVGLGWWGFQSIEQFTEDMRDPEARAAKVRDTLGAEELPPGFHPGIALSVPLALDMAVLVDEPMDLPEDGSFEMDEEDFSYDTQMFFFLRIRPMGRMKEELEEFFAGQRDSAEAFGDQSPGFQARRPMARGEMEIDGVAVRYRTDFGVTDDARPALVARLQWRCPGASRLHLGTWYTAAPDSMAPDSSGPDSMAEGGAVDGGESSSAASDPEDDPRGSLLDESRMRDVLSYFAPCR